MLLHKKLSCASKVNSMCSVFQRVSAYYPIQILQFRLFSLMASKLKCIDDVLTTVIDRYLFKRYTSFTQ